MAASPEVPGRSLPWRREFVPRVPCSVRADGTGGGMRSSFGTRVGPFTRAQVRGPVCDLGVGNEKMETALFLKEKYTHKHICRTETRLSTPSFFYNADSTFAELL
ncbi:Hypp5616 [Branchiostoma lanceolatum]|uniref:Hypp5616 protein n=1 Tax=Branchiostoma lanceolatum TaxID=7740 RepID=A0A8J9VEG6_BRALA|nr:Hypp5616 [Branchiostoma lanceolatum]